MNYRIINTLFLLAVIASFDAAALVNARTPDDVSTDPGKQGLVGLRLAGTVVADNPEMSRAIIENGSGGQWAYREGELAGDALIKKILPWHVIIDAGRGEEVLIVRASGVGSSTQRVVAAQVSGGQTAPQEIPETPRIDARHQFFELDRADVNSALANIDRVMTREANFSAYTVYDRPQGLKISDISPDSILLKMGLGDGDIIKRVDDLTIEGPDQTAQFLQKVKEGGDVTIWVKGTRRSRQIQLKIE